MANKQIIFIPGKNPKPEAEQHRALLWRTLVEGVRRADRAAAVSMQACYPQFHLAAWNRLYYNEYKDITSDIPWIDALINKHAPTEQDISDAHSWHIKMDRLSLAIGDLCPILIRLLPAEIKSTADEIKRYFRNTDGVADKIRELFKKQLRPMLAQQDDVLLIGHSLGSVIAYDALWELTHIEGLKGKVDLITIGSPLGMQYIRRRLQGMRGEGEKSYPRLIGHWVNFAAEGDVAALNEDVSKRFHPMLEQGLVTSIEDHCHGLYNFFRSDEGLNCHRSYGYLVSAAVGSTIAAWWKHREVNTQQSLAEATQ